MSEQKIFEYKLGQQYQDCTMDEDIWLVTQLLPQGGAVLRLIYKASGNKLSQNFFTHDNHGVHVYLSGIKSQASIYSLACLVPPEKQISLDKIPNLTDFIDLKDIT